ncbi:MAG: hypothetical protein GW892_09865 [Armatimonadetes bacterium]|nr:hypothetical protein [Armatimonadota bacterium]NCQ29480.1 hypothetical protein [Armatimonadota bacterium]
MNALTANAKLVCSMAQVPPKAGRRAPGSREQVTKRLWSVAEGRQQLADLLQ